MDTFVRWLTFYAESFTGGLFLWLGLYILSRGFPLAQNPSERAWWRQGNFAAGISFTLFVYTSISDKLTQRNVICRQNISVVVDLVISQQVTRDDWGEFCKKIPLVGYKCYSVAFYVVNLLN